MQQPSKCHDLSVRPTRIHKSKWLATTSTTTVMFSNWTQHLRISKSTTWLDSRLTSTLAVSYLGVPLNLTYRSSLWSHDARVMMNCASPKLTGWSLSISSPWSKVFANKKHITSNQTTDQRIKQPTNQPTDQPTKHSTNYCKYRHCSN